MKPDKSIFTWENGIERSMTREQERGEDDEGGERRMTREERGERGEDGEGGGERGG